MQHIQRSLLAHFSIMALFLDPLHNPRHIPLELRFPAKCGYPLWQKFSSFRFATPDPPKVYTETIGVPPSGSEGADRSLINVPSPTFLWSTLPVLVHEPGVLLILLIRLEWALSITSNALFPLYVSSNDRVSRLKWKEPDAASCLTVDAPD
jgi:hypothetical protein